MGAKRSKGTWGWTITFIVILLAGVSAYVGPELLSAKLRRNENAVAANLKTIVNGQTLYIERGGNGVYSQDLITLYDILKVSGDQSDTYG